MDALKENIAQLLCEKGSLKQRIFENTVQHFAELKKASAEMTEWMSEETCTVKENLALKFEDLNTFEGGLYFGGDMLFLNMHTNIFTFERNHPLWRHAYIKEDKNRAYFGVIHIYNFLADSFRYHRQKDLGVLLCRLFVNAQGHFFTEGQRNLAKPLSNIQKQVLSQEVLQSLLAECVDYALRFDLTAPAFNDVMTASVNDLKAHSSELQMRTVKKLGYKY